MARRKKTKIKENIGIQEFGKFKIGDEVWYVRVDKKIKKGKKVKFHPLDKPEPSLSVMDAVEGRYQVSPVSCCSFSKPDLKNKSWNCKKE